LRLQPIYDIAEICAQQGVSHAIACPGSRSAPLTLAFANHSAINCMTISDERSAAFIAIGISQQNQQPVSLVSTSGSAAYNFAPAIAEAFFQHIPLLIFTADRPTEWIDQWDGQTIRQQNIFGNHVKQSFQLPHEYTHPDSIWHLHRIVNEAIILSQTYPKGPVHINVPLREPLYPEKNEKIAFSKNIKRISVAPTEQVLNDAVKVSLLDKLKAYTRVLVVGGQQDFHEGLANALKSFCKTHHAVLVGDIISNLHAIPGVIQNSDVFLGQCGEDVKKTLAPELLITFGKSVISKSLKQFLRKYKPGAHWHIQPNGNTADTFQSLTQLIHCSPQHFFEQLATREKNESFEHQKKSNYSSIWKAEENRTSRHVKDFFREPQFSEFAIVKELLDALPARCNLHLANSMAVRYANFIGLSEKNKGVHVYANRGTSGIDGCTSTAVGHALSSEVPNILITGDMAFFYDRNAFWHNYPIPNLHIAVINNHGGVIFNLIDGPDNLKEKDEYFITNQRLTASHLAGEFDFDYLKLDSLKKIKNLLKDFYEFDNRTKILEVASNRKSSKETFEQFKNTIKKSYEA
jgi:2-succinyl-5-enolpyruvyl-6-hydroxy-3-cyclohexene-1-carboxylate synthase